MGTATKPTSDPVPKLISKDEVIFNHKVKMCSETFTELFGSLEINVVFQAIATWIGMIIFNTQHNPWQRREVAKRFQTTLEETITSYEQGKLP